MLSERIASANSACSAVDSSSRPASARSAPRRAPYAADKLAATRNVICRAQAEVNFHVLEPISERELSNSTWFDRLCLEWEKQIEDPDDILREAERVKQERGLSETKGAKKPAG